MCNKADTPKLTIKMTENIISGIIGGLFVLVCQLTFEYFKNKQSDKKKLKVGDSALQILDKEFLYKYEPHKYSIEKIISDFGQPIKKYTESFDNIEVEVFQYNFQNAKVLFAKQNDSSEIISVTLFSTIDNKNPVLCRLSFEEEDSEMGKAVINETIINEKINFENHMYTFGMRCIIQSKYFYRQIKHLTFSYQIGGNFDSPEDAKGEIIEQVCVSQLSSVTPLLSVHDTFYA